MMPPVFIVRRPSSWSVQWPLRRQPRHRSVQALSRRASSVALAGFCSVSLFGASVIGAHALFTASAKVAAQVGAGSVIVTWNAAGNPESVSDPGALSMSIDGLSSANVLERTADLTNSGTIALSVIQLQISPTDDAALAISSPSDGLQLAIDRCPSAWIPSATDATFSCAGEVTVVTADRPASAVIDLGASAALNTGETDHLRFTLRLPVSSPNPAQFVGSGLRLLAVGQQVAGVQK